MQEVEVTRDSRGMWVHPDLPNWGENVSDEAMQCWFMARGLSFHSVLMEGELGEKWCNGELDDCLSWTPKTEVEDSFLIGIWDTPDGVVAAFASPLIIETPEQVKRDAWIAEYALLLIKQCHFDIATAIKMGEATLENLDYDIEGTTPSEAVDDEIDAMRSDC